jgi:hypothetical protein
MEALSPKTRQASPGVVILLLVFKLLCLLLSVSSFLPVVLRLWRLSTRGTAARTGSWVPEVPSPARRARCGRMCACVSRVVAAKSETGGRQLTSTVAKAGPDLLALGVRAWSLSRSRGVKASLTDSHAQYTRAHAHAHAHAHKSHMAHAHTHMHCSTNESENGHSGGVCGGLRRLRHRVRQTGSSSPIHPPPTRLLPGGRADTSSPTARASMTFPPSASRSSASSSSSSAREFRVAWSVCCEDGRGCIIPDSLD